MLSRPLLSACFALTVAACSPDGARDAGRDAIVQQPPPHTLDFVIDELQIDPDDDPQNPHSGFNLDGLYSTEGDPGGCTHRDYFSRHDIDQQCVTGDEQCTATPGCLRGAVGCRGGVDNQLPTIARLFRERAFVDANMEMGDRITLNQFVLLVRVTNIDDLTNDDSVRVAFYGGFPRFTTGCTWVAGGRQYSIDRAFLTGNATDVDADARIVFDGSIVNGRLRVESAAREPVLSIPIVTARPFIPLVEIALHALHFRAYITRDDLALGSLGGWTPASDLMPPTSCVCPDYASVVRDVIGGLVDIEQHGVCNDRSVSPPRFGAISSGFGVHAVSARVSEEVPIADAASPGVCGCRVRDGGDGG